MHWCIKMFPKSQYAYFDPSQFLRTNRQTHKWAISMDLYRSFVAVTRILKWTIVSEWWHICYNELSENLSCWCPILESYYCALSKMSSWWHVLKIFVFYQIDNLRLNNRKMVFQNIIMVSKQSWNCDELTLKEKILGSKTRYCRNTPAASFSRRLVKPVFSLRHG